MLEPFIEEAIRFCLRFQSKHAISVSVIPNTQTKLIRYFLATPRRYKACVLSCLIDQVANSLLKI